LIRAVLDTNVLDSAFRSNRGYSFEVFVALRQDHWRAVLSNHLIHEFEEVPKAHAAELSLSLADIDTLLDAICARAEEWQFAPGWLPILADPDDEPLVQLAYDSAARRIVTHNIRHLRPARALGFEVLLPREFAAMFPRHDDPGHSSR
jgi:predicted nucleic acid-binding protein